VSFGPTLIDTDGVRLGITIIVLDADTLLTDGQAALLVNVTLTLSPSAGVYVYVVPVPTADVPMLHVYVGVVPPLLPVAVYVTEVPAHTVSDVDATMLTTGVDNGVIVIAAASPIIRTQPAPVVPFTVYIPAPVFSPKFSALPVPASIPTLVVPCINV
jgi:hypothetical protein